MENNIDIKENFIYELDENIEEIYLDKDYTGYKAKKFSYKAYNIVKEAFETMTLEEILAIREIKKEKADE